MHSTRLFSLSLCSVLVLSGCSGFMSDTDGENQSSSASSLSVDSQSSGASVSDIIPLAPVTNEVVVSPLSVTGMARGTWYFEASFPVRLFDGNGVEIAVAPAQAQGEWMTEEYVPYSAVLEFALPDTLTGTLVLQKDNPSGLPEYDESVEIPVLFQ